MPVAVEVAPDGGSLRLVRRPLQIGVVESIAPLKNESRGNGHLAVEAEDVDEVAGEHSADEQEPAALEIDHLRRREPMFALLLHVHKPARILRIPGAVQGVADPGGLLSGRLGPVHREAFLDAPDIEGVVGRIGAGHVAEERTVDLPAEPAVGRERSEN